MYESSVSPRIRGGGGIEHLEMWVISLVGITCVGVF